MSIRIVIIGAGEVGYNLSKFLSKEEFNLLQSVLRSASTELDAVHNKIEADLNARKS